MLVSPITVGHFTFRALVLRELLATFSAACAFSQHRGRQRRRPWVPVIRELQVAASPTFLSHRDLLAPQCPEVSLFDASPWSGAVRRQEFDAVFRSLIEGTSRKSAQRSTHQPSSSQSSPPTTLPSVLDVPREIWGTQLGSGMHLKSGTGDDEETHSQSPQYAQASSCHRRCCCVAVLPSRDRPSLASVAATSGFRACEADPQPRHGHCWHPPSETGNVTRSLASSGARGSRDLPTVCRSPSRDRSQIGALCRYNGRLGSLLPKSCRHCLTRGRTCPRG